MMNPLDFDLVVSHGTVPRSTGRFGRRRVPERLPDVPFGQAQVVRSANGTLVEASAGRTAGERYWSHDDSWFHVDVSPHSLSFEFRHASPRSTADHLIKVEVSARVVSAPRVIELNVHTARPHVLTKLSALVDTATSAFDASVAKAFTKAKKPAVDEPVIFGVLDERAAMRRKVRKHLATGDILVISGWLECRIVSSQAELDGETVRHLEALRGAERSSEMATAEYRVKLARDVGERSLRTLWAEHFGDRLSAPLTRAVEVAASDPSPGNIEKVVRQLDAAGREARGEFITVLQSLINKDLVAEVGDISAFHAILTELQGTGTRPSAPELTEGKVIVGSDRLPPIDESRDDATDATAEDKKWGG